MLPLTAVRGGQGVGQGVSRQMAQAWRLACTNGHPRSASAADCHGEVARPAGTLPAHWQAMRHGTWSGAQGHRHTGCVRGGRGAGVPST